MTGVFDGMSDVLLMPAAKPGFNDTHDFTAFGQIFAQSDDVFIIGNSFICAKGTIFRNWFGFTECFHKMLKGNVVRVDVFTTGGCICGCRRCLVVICG